MEFGEIKLKQIGLVEVPVALNVPLTVNFAPAEKLIVAPEHIVSVTPGATVRFDNILLVPDNIVL